MSSFGTGSALTSGASINLTPYKGTDGNNAGTDGLVPGPAALQAGHILGAGGDWTLTVKEVNDGNGQIDVNESSNRIATTKFVQTLIGNAQLGGGNANLSALGDTQFANLGADQFLQYNGNKWVNVDFTLDTISNVNLAGLAVGNTIVWDGAEWVPGVGGGGGANNLDGLTDVEINGGDVNHFLVRDANGKYVNRVISTSDLDNGDKVVLIDAPATFGAHAYDFTVSTVSVKAPQADAHVATKKYVDDEINGIDLTTKQDADASLDTITGIGNKDLLLGNGADSFEKVNVSAGVETFLKSAGSIDNLTDVDTTTDAPQNGEVLKWDGNNFVPSADTGKTDAEIKDIVGGMVEGNTETGISVDYDAVNRNLDFAVSLGGFSVRELSDVSNDALVNGKILKVVNGVLTQVDETDTNTQLTDNQVKDIVGEMVAGNTETGISVDYDAVNRNLDFVVASISSSDLTDGGVNGNISLLDANQTLSGNKTFTGTVSLGANATATTQNASNNSTSVATTAYVDAQIDADIATLNLAGTYQGINANLTSISGLNIVDGSMIIGNNDNSFEIISIAQGVETFLGGTGSVGTLSDITLQAGAVGDVLRVSAVDVNDVPISFVNTKLSSGDLSDTTNISLLSANQTMSGNKIFTGTATFRDDITATTEGKFISVNTPTADAHVSTKKYVDDELTTGLATKQPLEATLTGLADIDPGNNDLIIGTGNNTFGVINTSAEVQTFLASDGSLDGLDNVTIAGNLGQALADGQVLRYDGANTEWKNSKIAFGDLADVASTQNVALLNGNQTFTGTIVFTNDITATTEGKFISANTPTADSHVATKKYVDDEMGAAGLVSSLTTLTDVTLGADNGNGVAEVVGQVLKIASIVDGDATYRNAQLAYTELSGTPVVGADIQAYNVALENLATMGTGANKIIYSTAEDTFAESDITDYTRSLLAEANEGAVKAYLNLESGTDIQAQNATLQGISDIGGVADGKIIYTDGGADTFATSDITTFALSILDDATDADVRTTLGLGTASTSAIGDFLASTSGLNALSDVTLANPSDAQILIFDGDEVGNDNDQFKNVSLSGVISIDNAGVVSFATDAIDENNIATAIKDEVITNTYLASPFVNLTDGANTDKLNLGETITFAGTASEIEVSTTADANGDVAGATVTVGLPQNVTIGNNLTVTGNLTVNGTTTTVDTTNMVIEDRVISLNSGEQGANANDIGLFFNRGTSDPALFIWDESVDKFKVGTENGATASQAGEYTLSLKKMEVETPANDSNSTEVATTEWVRDFNTNQGNAADLDGLTDVGIGDVALADAHFLIYDDAESEFRNKAISGDISINKSGQATIGALTVETGMIANNAITITQLAEPSVSSAQLYANAVTTAKILNANVTTAKIADQNVTVAKLANNAVETAKIKDANVTTAKLADSSVEASKLANDSVTTAKILNNNVTNEKLQNSSLTVGTTSISLGGSSTTLSGMTGINFTNSDATIGALMTTNNGNPTVLTLGGAGSKVDITSLLDVDTLSISTGTITDSTGSISFGDENLSTTGTLSAGVATLATGSSIGNLTLANASITDSGGSISFGNNNLSTTGTLSAGVATLATNSTIGNLTLANASITDSSGSISFGAMNLSTTGTLSTGVATLTTGSSVGNLTLANGSITDSSGSISFGDENLSTTGTLSAGVATLATGSSIGNLTLSNGSISDSGGAISFGNNTLTTTGTISGATGSTIGNLTLANGSITDSSGAISFGDENLSTTGTLGAGATTVSSLNAGNGSIETTGTLSAGVATLATGSSVGNLTLANGSITDSGGSISFGDENLSTTGTLSAGVATLATGSSVGNLTLSNGSISDSGGSISFGNNNLSTTGTISGATGSTVGNLTLANGSITDSSGSISFGDENLSTSGNITVNTDKFVVAGATGNTEIEGTLKVAEGNAKQITISAGEIVSADNTLSFGAAEITTTGIINGAKPDANSDTTEVATTNWVRELSIGALADVDLAGFDTDDQVLVWDADNSKFVKGTVPSAVTHYFSSQTNETSDLKIKGRFIETIDYGQITEAYNENNHFNIDFGSITDVVLYASEDYGVLVC